jgi:hypothetical protein
MRLGLEGALFSLRPALLKQLEPPGSSRRKMTTRAADKFSRRRPAAGTKVSPPNVLPEEDQRTWIQKWWPILFWEKAPY